MNSSPDPADAPLIAEGGQRAAPQAGEDPFGALDDLMAASEALWPVWPARKTFANAAAMLL
jgi:hypothetical protein